MHDEGPVLAGMQGDACHGTIPYNKHFMKFKAHIGKRPVQPVDGGPERLGPALASVHWLVGATMVEVIRGDVCFNGLDVSACREVQMLANQTLFTVRGFIATRRSTIHFRCLGFDAVRMAESAKTGKEALPREIHPL